MSSLALTCSRIPLSSFDGLDVDKEQRMIRLWRFNPFSLKGLPRLELANFAPPYPPYVALSYTWAKKGKNGIALLDTVPILVNDQELAITQNLWDFLLVLHANGSYGNQWFWADQVSINQCNILERNHQVSLMSDIYTRAEIVFGWLGMMSEEHSSKLDNFQSRWMGLQPVNTDIALTIIAIGEQDYWRRLWVVQELWLAERVVLWCHNFTIEPDILLHYIGRVLSYDTLDQYDRESEVTERLRTFQLTAQHRIKALLERYPRRSQSKQSLLSVLQKYGERECADSRDHLFGLQALVVEKQRLPVDYSITLETLLLRAVQIIALNTKWVASFRCFRDWWPEFDDLEAQSRKLLDFTPARQMSDDLLRQTGALLWSLLVPKLIKETLCVLNTELILNWHDLWDAVERHAQTAKQSLFAKTLRFMLKDIIELHQQPAKDRNHFSNQEQREHLVAEYAARHGFVRFGPFLSHPDDWPFPDEKPSSIPIFEGLHLR